MYMDNIEIENRIVELNNELNIEIELCKNLDLSLKKFKQSLIRINLILFDISDKMTHYTSDQPKKIVFVNLKHSLENLSKVDGFQPSDKNFLFNEYKQSILGRIHKIINTHAERVVAPTPMRSLSVKTPITHASAGGKTKTKTKTDKTKKNKTNKKR